jgi:hypothetical protein
MIPTLLLLLTAVASSDKSDLIPVEVSHPAENVWLVRPQAPLGSGEYALMLGTQNMNIYPFTASQHE